MKVLKSTDFLKVEIPNPEGMPINFYFRPMTFYDEMQIGEFSLIEGQSKIVHMEKIHEYFIKNLLKKVENITYLDGAPYQVQFEGDKLTNDCFETIISMSFFKSVHSAIMSMISRNTGEITNASGKPIEGVKIIPTLGGLDLKKNTI